MSENPMPIVPDSEIAAMYAKEIARLRALLADCRAEFEQVLLGIYRDSKIVALLARMPERKEATGG